MIENSSVLVTGASGFLGRWLCKALVENKNKVYALVHEKTTKADGLELIKGDITDYETIKDIGFDIDFCIHLAAMSSINKCESEPIHAVDVNILGTLNILELSKKLGVKGVIITSSGKVYGEQKEDLLKENMELKPSNNYEITKAYTDYTAQYFSLKSNMPVVIARLGNLYGPDDSDTERLVPHTILSLMKDKEPIIYGDGSRKRNYIYIKDVVDFYLFSLKMMGEQSMKGIFNIATGQSNSITEIVEKIKEITGKNIKPRILEGGDKKSDKLLSIEKAKSLGWSPKYDLDSGLRETVEWYLNHPPLSTPQS